MKKYITSRIISIFICGALFGVFVHYVLIKDGQMGRQAYLAKEEVRFDRDYANPPSLIYIMGESTIILGIGFIAYELIALGLSKILKIDEDSGSS